MAFLDIIVPQYNEDDETINTLLNSIATQEQINFEDINVIIVNDHSNKIISKELLDSYSILNIKYIISDKNYGPGYSRQIGYDNSNSKYVTYVDADDCLFEKLTLKIVIDYLKNNNIDVLYTKFIEEIMDNGESKPYLHKNDVHKYLHGQFYKREFLDKYDIKFDKELRLFEDTYYCQQVVKLSEPKLLDVISYLWRYNKNSIIRTNRKYHILVEHYNDILREVTLLTDKLSKYDVLNDEFILSSIYGLYMILESNLFDFDELKSLKEKYQIELYNIYIKYKYAFDRNNDIKKKECFDSEEKGLFKGENVKYLITFEQFINKMENQN
jgi:glycosyltransferase involved in cell wall biosynthesis